MKHLSKYVSRHVLDQIYKLYMKPHLDYGDIIYHRYDPDMQSTFTHKLEQIQYAAALAVTAAWAGTSRQRLHEELGWETLYQRRWYRRICHFFNPRKCQSPGYWFVEIPDERTVAYNLRIMRAYDRGSCKAVCFSNTHFRNALCEWNLLSDETKDSLSITEFKRKLLAIIRSLGKSSYFFYAHENYNYIQRYRDTTLRNTRQHHRVHTLEPCRNLKFT